MNFQFDGRQEELYNRITELCWKHTPLGLDHPDSKDKDEALKDYPEKMFKGLVDAGLFHLSGTEVDGRELEITDIIIMLEAAASVSYTALLMYMSTGPVTLIVHYGCSPEQQERWVPSLVSGKSRYAFGLVEPYAGSDLASMETTFEAAGDDYILNGCKNYVTGGAHADYIAIVARAVDAEDVRKATTVFVVPTDAPGVQITNRDVSVGRSVGCAEVVLDNVKVSRDNLLGAENEGWGMVTLASGYSRLLVAAGALGMARNVFAKAQTHAREREQFGQPIGNFQAVSQRLADMATSIDAMKLLTYQAASLVDEGDVADKEISMAKLFCSEKLNEIVQQAMQIMGGGACFNDSPIGYKLEEAMTLLYWGGTSDKQRSIINKGLNLEFSGA